MREKASRLLSHLFLVSFCLSRKIQTTLTLAQQRGIGYPLRNLAIFYASLNIVLVRFCTSFSLFPCIIIFMLALDVERSPRCGSSCNFECFDDVFKNKSLPKKGLTRKLFTILAIKVSKSLDCGLLIINYQNVLKARFPGNKNFPSYPVFIH